MNRQSILAYLIFFCSAVAAQPDAAEVQITELPVGPEKKGPELGEAPFTLEPLEPEVRVEDFALQQPLVPEPTREPKKIVPRKRRTREPQAAAVSQAEKPVVMPEPSQAPKKQKTEAELPVAQPPVVPEAKGPESIEPAPVPELTKEPKKIVSRRRGIRQPQAAVVSQAEKLVVTPEPSQAQKKQKAEVELPVAQPPVAPETKGPLLEPLEEEHPLEDFAHEKPPTKEEPIKKVATPRKRRRKEPVEALLAEQPRTPSQKREIEKALETTITTEQTKQEISDTFKKQTKRDVIHLGTYLEPWKDADPNEMVEMNFDNKELTELLKFLSDSLDITFILDDDIEPTRAEGLQPLAGTRITFKSNVPLTLKQAWEYGLTFIEMAGFSVIPATLPRTYRITANASKDKPSANREPLPTFIGTDPALLPNNDTKIRYVYFAENAELPTIIQIIEALKSGSSGPLIDVPPLRAVIMTDKAANIRSILQILQEIDRVTLPETLAIIRLKHTDARQVRELYHKLIGKDPQAPQFNPFSRQRKSTSTQYFTEATRVFEEPYTNSLIVLGTRENIKRFEDFILKYVDRTLDIPFSPLHIIQLKYIDAASIAKILNDIILKFNSDPANVNAALVGGVRDGNKFFRPTVRITDEPSGNRLIINSDYEEYLKLREIIEALDVEQPQVAIKVLILDVDLTDTETLGTQLRNSVECCDKTGGTTSLLGKNVNFQTSNVGPIVTRETITTAAGTMVANGSERLLGNLINLANQVSGVSPFAAGTTLITLGKDIFGFWGLLEALQTYTRVSVVANPFLVTTNKYKSEIKVGETRRTTTALVEGQREAQAQGDLSADLRVVITPQISYDDMVTLNVYIEIGQFINATTQNRIIKKLSTEALLANKEVLALGGLIQDSVTETINKVPILGDIPFVGWLFKSKTKTISRTSTLILIAPEIIKPYQPEVAQAFTFSKITDAKEVLYGMVPASDRRDPIYKWMFKDHKDKETSTIDKFAAMQQRYFDESQRKPETVAMKAAQESLLDELPSDDTKQEVPA